MNDSLGSCYACGEPFPGPAIHRGDYCSKCRADLKVCRNCKHYDQSAYNFCREPQADRVVEKEKSNFCDYFAATSKSTVPPSESPAEKARKMAEALFKKK